MNDASLPGFSSYSSAIGIVMKRNEADHEVQQVCCGALMNWASIEFSFQNDVSSYDFIEAIRDAMVYHNTDVVIQQHGCAAIMYLAENHKDSQATIARVGCITSVVNAMNSQATNPKIQQLWLDCLCGFQQGT